MLLVMCGSRTFSIILAMGESRDMGLYEVPSVESLSGLRIGMMFACFQICGILFVLSDMLYSCVRYVSVSEERCFKCCMHMLSGPDVFLFLDVRIAYLISAVVSRSSGVCNFSICLSIFRFVLRVLCGVAFMNCLFNACAICLCLWYVLLVLLPKDIEMLLFVCCFLPFMLLMIDHNL